MDKKEKKRILTAAQDWFEKSVSQNHIKNTKKLVQTKEFNINPFLLAYLSNFLTGNSEPHSLAKALIYPRVLGTSITTSFGTQIQNFTNEVLSAYGSTTSGIDIEFIDQLDRSKKYCQLKSGPNTINKDDVETISIHFKKVINLARTNNLKIGIDDLIVGVIYGTTQELSSHYKRITRDYNYPVIIGEEFWQRLTGDKDFYYDLIESISNVAIESNFKNELASVIDELSSSEYIQNLSKELKS